MSNPENIILPINENGQEREQEDLKQYARDFTIASDNLKKTYA